MCYSRSGGLILDYYIVAVSEFTTALQLSIETVVEWCDCKSLVSTVSELLNACQDGTHALACSGIGWEINDTYLE